MVGGGNQLSRRIVVNGGSRVYRHAAASMTPAPLKRPGLVTTTSTGYFHCMNLVQPDKRVSRSFLERIERNLSYSSKHSGGPNTCQQMAPGPSSEAALTAQCFPAIPPRHQSSRRKESPSRNLLLILREVKQHHRLSRIRTSSRAMVSCMRTWRTRDWTRHGEGLPWCR